MPTRKSRLVPSIADDQLVALEVFKDLIKDAEGRREYVNADGPDGKQEVYDRHRNQLDDERLQTADYSRIEDPARTLLERLSDSELALLSDLDAAFVEAGLSVTANPSPLMVH
ncbi:MAG TPA: hypothetical protein VH834_12055 [Solirubrobacteraceae bacterium]|jgi:hypothetical protein